MKEKNKFNKKIIKNPWFISGSFFLLSLFFSPKLNSLYIAIKDIDLNFWTKTTNITNVGNMYVNNSKNIWDFLFVVVYFGVLFFLIYWVLINLDNHKN